MYCSDHDYVSHHSAASEDCDQLGVWPQPQPLSYPECPAYSSGYNDVLESQNIADIKETHKHSIRDILEESLDRLHAFLGATARYSRCFFFFHVRVRRGRWTG